MNKKTIITSILLIVLCLSLISGSTYALFTSESKINIAVTSGKVDVRANISIYALYSAEANPNGNLLDEHNNKYVHVQQTGVDENGKKLFANGGKVYQDMQGVLNLERMSPGDKVSVVLSVANYSDISAKYRLKFEVPEGGKKLATILVTTIGTTSYTGLSKYRSPWQDIQIGQNPYYNFTIEMPMNAGNEYQGLSSNMVITVEAVQGNASTDDELLIETFALQTSTKTVTLTNGNATVNTSISPSEEVHPTTIEISNTNLSGTATLGVSTSGLVTNIGKSFVVAENTLSETTVNNVVGTISFDLFDLSQNKTVTTFTSGYAKVSTYITKGIEDVGVIYTGVDTAFSKDNPGTKKNSEELVLEHGDYYYNSVTGLLVFITDHFSEFLITSDDAKVYVPELSKVFTSLNDAITACEEGNTIILLKDITLPDDFVLNKAITIKGLSSNASDDNIKVSNPIITSVPLLKTVTYEDITFNGKAGYLTFSTNFLCNLVLNKVKITSNSNTSFHHDCVGTVTLNNVTIANTGYNSGETTTNKDAAIAVSQGGNVIINGGTYSSDNGYAVYVFSTGGTVTINDGKFDGKICANIDRTTYDNRESHIIINGGEFTNSDFSAFGEQGYVTIEIRGGKFNSDPTAYSTTYPSKVFVDTTKYDVTNTSGIWVVTLKNQVNP